MNDISKLLLVLAMALMMSAICTSLAIPILKRKQAGQSIRDEGPQSHKKKEGTPTMGGIAILIAIGITAIATKQFSPDAGFIGISLIAFGLIGFADDYMKVKKKHNLGLRAWQKILLQTVVSAALVVYFMASRSNPTLVIVPFTDRVLDFSNYYLLFGILLLVASSNSVNLTDGLDGLASGVSAIVAAFFAVAGASLGFMTESLFGVLIAGACLGFLVFNRYPAKVFMGDTGSMALGGGLAAFSMATNLELFLPIVGIVFVLEALSVILQVASFKLTGKRIFKMAPLHHHFELSGMKEQKVAVMLWVITIIFAAVAFGGL